MILSTHAKEQMARRGISRASVLAVLIHGRKIPTDLPYVMRYELEGLVVVEDVQNEIVVTAFHDAGPKYKRRKKRHGTAKP